MFNIGDQIVYGSTGICTVMEIGPSRLHGSDPNRLFYALKPMYQDGLIYTPVDGKVFMRPVISRPEAVKLIKSIPSIHAEAYHERSLTMLTTHYESILKKHDCRELLELTMSLYVKRKAVLSQNRKFGLIDERFMKRAEDLLFGELAVALEIEREAVPEYIRTMINK